MEIHSDNNFNKIIIIPYLNADDNAEPYRHLHLQTLGDFDAEETFNNLYFKKINEMYYGIVIEFVKPLLPNVLFRFSQNLIEKLAEVEDVGAYIVNCNFYCWTDDVGKSHIRLAKQIEFIEETIIFQ